MVKNQSADEIEKKAERLKYILETEFGITTREQLSEALDKTLKDFNIGVMTCKPNGIHTA